MSSISESNRNASTDKLENAVTDSDVATPEAAVKKPAPPWVNWILPSITDVIFLVLLLTLALRQQGTGLLGDADIGWHIRNGEGILATHLVPRTDSFSYTHAGQPWYAWEWLYDIGIAAIHHVSGLNGVVLFTLLLVCGTFALLFRLLLRRCGNLVVAAGLTMVSAAASQLHLLARPHVLSWLFSLLAVAVLYRFADNQGKGTAKKFPRELLWMPILMLVWVNVHGGFILGLALVGIFGCGVLWRYLTLKRVEDLKAIGQLGAVLVVCLATTLLTPYGYQLHVHVYQYLSSNFLMNTIDEFSSPNFHAAGTGYFEFLILIAVAGCALGWKRLTITDLFLALFAIHAGLFAVRNVPISAILLSMALSPAIASVVSPNTGKDSRPHWLSILLEKLDAVACGMGEMEQKFRGHAVVLLLVAACCAVAWNGGRLLNSQMMTASFDEKRFPVKATEYLAQMGVHDHLFCTDSWSGYVIYKLYPGIHLFFDDRHDFYGEAFVRQYIQAVSGAPGWADPLNKNQVNWVLVPESLPLASLLKESPEWRVDYSDNVAILFKRRVMY